MALLVFLIMFFTKANAVDNDESVTNPVAKAVENEEFKECLDFKSFHYDPRHEVMPMHKASKAISAQCIPSKSSGAFYTANSRTHWECLDTKSKWPDKEEIKEKIKQGFVGFCKFGRSNSKIKKGDVEVCEQNPLQCAPGPKMNWGACVAKDVGGWKCIPQEEEREGDIDNYVKGDCLTFRVKNTQGKELYNSVCRFPTEKDAAYPKPVRCPKEEAEKAPEGSKSACFITKVEGHEPHPLLGPYREEGDQVSDPCEWTLSNAHILNTVISLKAESTLSSGLSASAPHGFYEGECLFPTHKGYAKAQDWSTVKPLVPGDKPNRVKPAPVNPAPAPAPDPTPVNPAPAPAPDSTPVKPASTDTENGGVGIGWIVCFVFLMLAAGGGVFLFCQHANKTGPQALSGGLSLQEVAPKMDGN